MYAYIDETGNTGRNIFDAAQPFFMTAALITKINFDVVYGDKIKTLARELGVETLHANELGAEKIEQISGKLLAIFTTSDASFFVSRIEKKYLAVTKIVDTVFDSCENLSVPWHIYNLRSMRLLLVFKVASILTEEMANEFWESILEKNKDLAYKKFVAVLEKIRPQVCVLPDERSRQLITEAIDWAAENPEAIYIHTNSNAARNGHLPNMVAFPALLEGIDQWSKLWKSPVVEIVHDRQSQFQTTLKEYHRLYSTASPDVIRGPDGEAYIHRKVFGSNFSIRSAVDSPGIQAIDIVLWLFRRLQEGRHLYHDSALLMMYVCGRGRQHDLSFETVGSSCCGKLENG